jgi:predicted GNAT family N-acyltransferase
MDWKCCEFNQMTARELYEVLRMRSAVFVVEYAHIHLDLDNRDEEALHVFAFDEGRAGLRVMAYARLFPGDDQDPEVMIDRILTHPERRDDDTHGMLIAHALAAASAMGPEHPIHADVPAYREACYEAFGFKKIAGPFLECGISCLTMVWRPSVFQRRMTTAVPVVQWISPPAVLLARNSWPIVNASPRTCWTRNPTR